MAKPQLEDGHTQIANEILEQLSKVHLAPNQWQVLMCIIRKTYGFHKKVDYIANSQIVEATGLCKAVVSRAIHSLCDMKVLNRNGKSIGFQKDWEEWEELAIPSTKVSSIANNNKLAEQSTLGTKLAKQLTATELAIPSTKLAIPSTELAIPSTKVSSPAVTQKIKDTYTKEIIQKKEHKKSYGEFNNVFLTDNEYQKLIGRFGEVGVKERIEVLSAGIASHGYKYKDYYATILAWEKRDKKEAEGGAYRGNISQGSKKTTNEQRLAGLSSEQRRAYEERRTQIGT